MSARRVELAYGRTGLTVSIPEGWDPVVLRSRERDPLPLPRETILRALRGPIGSRPLAAIASEAGPRAGAGIIFNDVTRATPNELIVGTVVDELVRAGIAEERITLYNATGTHRANTAEELDRMLGARLARGFRVVQNDCEAPDAHTLVGTTAAGNEVRILTQYLREDIRVATGFVEPHFFAGYSGGGKAVVPGLAHLSTILHNHGPHHMDHPQATWGRTVGNPLWEDLAEAASFADPLFLVNVTMNRRKEVTGVFAGERIAAHREGCRQVAHDAVVAVDREFDVVVTSNSGYPLDLNLYQTVKGMSAAARIVREGGRIIVAAECWDGLPAHGLFARLVREAESAEALLERLRGEDLRVRDAWQAHIFALVRRKAQITLVSGGIPASEVPRALCESARSVEEALEAAATTAPAVSANAQASGDRAGDRAGGIPSVCFLPDGPLTIPVIASR